MVFRDCAAVNEAVAAEAAEGSMDMADAQETGAMPERSGLSRKANLSKVSIRGMVGTRVSRKCEETERGRS